MLRAVINSLLSLPPPYFPQASPLAKAFLHIAVSGLYARLGQLLPRVQNLRYMGRTFHPARTGLPGSYQHKYQKTNSYLSGSLYSAPLFTRGCLESVTSAARMCLHPYIYKDPAWGLSPNGVRSKLDLDRTVELGHQPHARVLPFGRFPREPPGSLERFLHGRVALSRRSC
jgi:hypothetical protein